MTRIQHEIQINKDFSQKGTEFANQYSNIYFTRKNSLKFNCISTQIVKLDSVNAVWITGSIYKNSLKPNILTEINNNAIEPVLDKYTRDDDYFLIEDETARVKINDANNVINSLVTGCCVSLYGTLSVVGEFCPTQVLYPILVPLPQLGQISIALLAWRGAGKEIFWPVFFVALFFSNL